ncbi:Hypothetical protein PP7435_CHR2-0249 [Komagataella phaffii CBS 7435]|uniref:Uncharacterized protein n=2 Tax=Komagataella phaffii TaxID=460519 RepID=C4R2F5_KOMPG|nr:Hypothetical protein PAS_chr2-2_0237 [Komagataella phaffii GS115]AOA62768.1 GQ67_01098T0 [Komagataella phaffii]KAI0462130.1 hypothetical protein LJB42_004217 [Komagataella kurtzmanii]CAH2447768.1 Hypothetical protein BQ9382_C2-1365 [Komagataella phaffii CBS 7435]AOA68074.1 GQ68_00291T0 [Komagataella phaffii GS115]CAY69679.1 Hypothetical protein PAS_chr2-2_0237 [Komagataella phaffii GS115]
MASDLKQFEELDKQLNQDQRLELATFFSGFTRKLNQLTYAGFLGGLVAPFIYRYAKHRTTVGVNFKHSILLGMLGMAAAPTLLGPGIYEKRCQQLRDKDVEYKIATFFPFYFSIHNWNYYAITAKDPSRAIEFRGANKDKRKPGLLASGDLFGIKGDSESEGYPQWGEKLWKDTNEDNQSDQGDYEGRTTGDYVDQESKVVKSSSWEKIRKGNE